MPPTRLFEPGHVFHARGGSDKVQCPAFARAQGHRVLASEQHKLFGTDFLVVVTRQSERELGGHWQDSAEPIRAEPVGVEARSTCEAHAETLLEFRKRVSQQSARPKKMAGLLDLAITCKAVDRWPQPKHVFIP